MSEDRVREIQQRVEKATPGEHVVLGKNVSTKVENFHLIGPPAWAPCAYVAGLGDAEFYANARQDIPYLLSRLQAAETQNAKLETENERWMETVRVNVERAVAAETRAESLGRELVEARKERSKP